MNAASAAIRQPRSVAAKKPQSRVYTTLLTVVLILTAMGLLAVFTAASEYSELHHDGDVSFMFIAQAKRVLIGLVLLFAFSRIPYEWWKILAIPAIATAGLLVALVSFDTPLAHTANGATRWLRFGSFQFQPAELARYALVLFIAWWGWKHGRAIRDFKKGMLPVLAIIMALAGLIVMQPDFSTAAMLVATALVLLFVAGARVWHLLLVLAPVLIGGFAAVISSPYRVERFFAMLNPFKDPSDSGYQLLQSFTGMGRGGLFGVGPGASRQKLFFLPEAHTDFIYAIIGEEFGFIGALTLLILFLMLIYTGLRAARRAPEPFGAFLAAGITLSIGFYAMANMGVTVGLLPPTGLPLPLISYGGTSLLMTMGALGILLNIARSADAQGIPVKKRKK